MNVAERVIALWFPDWPVTAFLRTQARELGVAEVDPDAPIALVHAGGVVACSAAARAAGVRRGQRRRDAQSACPRLRLVQADDARDARAFHDAMRIVEELSPGVQALRSGLAVLRARGPSRFYGGEEQAALALLGPLHDAGFADMRAGIADGVFTAEHAAHEAEGSAPVRIVAAGGSSEFLAPFPVRALGDEEVALFLNRLGVRTLGGFAGLDASLVADRLGEHGLRLHACASGADPREIVPRVPPPELTSEISFEAPLELAEQVAFAARRTVEDFHGAISRAGLVCTAVRITVVDDDGRRSERVWQHPVSFDAASIVDRIRWQLQDVSDAGAPGQQRLSGSVTSVRLEPEAVDHGTAHQPTLIGQGPDERAHHAMTRVQAVLGHRGVLSPEIAGGRALAEREVLRPWDDASSPRSARDRPWPGVLPAPLPSEVFRAPRPAEVRGAAGADCAVDGRGLLTAEPATIDGRRVVSWAGPWPLIERDWDSARRRSAHRFQLVDETGAAWLAVRAENGWWLEGRYG
ncbi:DNA polymerase Y family protein [Microbacterium halotolerans]|uniref:DNA polymerase Y family protein n=1 Tax=Microbacterium halotolerans TaxID=246613 RepID=UPI000E6A9875|nr:DNA polymerase Y family protein [Microbacterium halotolerans]